MLGQVLAVQWVVSPGAGWLANCLRQFNCLKRQMH